MKCARGSRPRCRRRWKARRSRWPRSPKAARRSSTSWKRCVRFSTRKRPRRPQRRPTRRRARRPREPSSRSPPPGRPRRNNTRRRSMHQYGVHDVERLLHLPRSTIRSLVNAGFVSPARGPRKWYLFSFQDLIVLRTAQALAAAKVPTRRITKSLKELPRHLPDAMPLSGLSNGAVGNRVVVSEGASRWQAESGQYLLALEGNPADGSLCVVERNDAGAVASRYCPDSACQ